MRSTASALLGAGLVLSSLAIAQEKVQLSIGTGGTGGVYYPLGGGMANVLSKSVPGMSATAEVTGGSVDNLKLVASGKPYLAMTMADAGQDAYRGEDKFKGAQGPAPDAHDHVPEPHARGHHRGDRHQHAGGPQGQARVHRLAGERDRGHGRSG